MATEGEQTMSNGGIAEAANFLGSKDPVDSDSSSAMALQKFFSLSIAAGIYNLGVLLEILHVANYDAEKASRIVELIKGSPPTEPAIIATCQQQQSSDNNPKGPTTNGTSCVQNADCAVQAFGDGLVSSAAAASPYSAAVVSCAPGSAGVGVGTSSGTTTSTAVPLSAVTSLPQNSNINVDFSQPGCAKCSISPNCSGSSSGAAAAPKSGLQTTTTSTAAPNQTVNGGLLGVKAQTTPSGQQEQQPSSVSQALPLLQNKRAVVPGKPQVGSTSTPGHVRAAPSKSAPTKTPAAESQDNGRPQSQAGLNSASAATKPPNVTAPVIDEIDPLKISKLQEIIDILKA